MAHMITLIHPADKLWYIQIGNQDKFETFNLHFENNPIGNMLKGFSIPCLGSEPVWDIYGDRYSRTIVHVTKALPKIVEASATVERFLRLLVKMFKIEAYQINVNSDFDWSNLTTWDVSAAVVITNDLRRAGFPIDF